MRTLLQSAAVLALLTCSVGTAVIVWDAHKFLRESTTAVQHVSDVALNANDTIWKGRAEWAHEEASIHEIIVSTAEAANQADLFATEQRAQLAKTSRDSDNQVRALGLVTRNAEKFFYNLDQQLNGRILPDFDAELKSTSTAAQFSFESMTHAGDALTFQLQDPELGHIFQNFNAASSNLSAAAGSGASILAHGDHVAAYYDKKLTTPVGFARSMVNFTLDTGSKLGNIMAGFVK